METKPPVPRVILVGIQVPSVDDVAHAASLEELGRLVKTLGYDVVGTMSQKRDGIGGGTVLGKGRLEELAAARRNPTYAYRDACMGRIPFVFGKTKATHFWANK